MGFATEASIHPPRFLAGLSKRNHTFRVAQDASHLAVHVLSRQYLTIVELFGGQTGDRINKFDRCDWHDGPEGMPILDDAAGWFVGGVLDRFDFGDHVGHLLVPVAGGLAHECTDLVSLADVRELPPGHEA
jgi:flavin reductase (DIM6/NTAB) family NADH-FMN oxidoreductase RutF